MNGCGEMADAFHRTRSSPDGKPIIGCIRNALADAGLTPDDIDYVNPHGTGTPENDKMEAMGVMAVFGERAKTLPMSSNKSMVGHTLSAAGAVEAVFSLLTLRAPAHPADHQLPGAGSCDSARRGAERGARRAGRARHLQFVRLRRTERLAGHGARTGVTATIRALTLLGDRKLELAEVPAPPPPAAGEVQIARQGGGAQSHRRLGLSRHGFRQAQAAAGGRRRGRGRNRRGRRRRDRLQARRPGGDVRRADLRHLQGLPRRPRQSVRERRAASWAFMSTASPATCVNMPARLVIPVPKGVSHARRRLRADRILDRRAHAVRQCQAPAGRNHPGAGRRLRHRHGRDQDGQGDRLHRHHHGRRRRKGGKGQGARRRSRHQLPHRAVRDDHAQAHQQEGRRCGVRARRRRRFQRLAAGAEARRAAGHLRLDRRAQHHLQPDAAVPAAIQDLRIVRRFDAQHPRQPRQDGERTDSRSSTPKSALADLERGIARLESRQVFGKIVVKF